MEAVIWQRKGKSSVTINFWPKSGKVVKSGVGVPPSPDNGFCLPLITGSIRVFFGTFSCPCPP